MRRLILALALLGVAPCAMAHDHATAQYLGNEGILVSKGDTKVLFDAFYAQSFGQYQLVPEETRKAMMEGKAPYDGVDAIFVSHVHGDHFTAEPMLAYLRANPAVRLFASKQVIDAVTEILPEGEDTISERMTAFDLQPGDSPKAMSVGEVSFDVVAIPHAGGPGRAHIQNLIFRVSVDEDATVMHLGDADPDEAVWSAQEAHWRAKKTHTAFPPYWFLDTRSGRAILDQQIKADHVIGIHVPSRARGNGDWWRERLRGDLFTDPGETRSIGTQTE